MPVRSEFLYPLPVGDDRAFPGSGNIILSEPGKVQLSFDNADISGSDDLLHYPTAFIHTKAPNGNPRIYFSANKTVYRIEGGVRTVDTTFADVIQHMAIVNTGATPYATEVLGVVFGDSVPSVTNANAYRSLSTDTTPWTTNTNTASKTTAFFLERVGPHLYGATGSLASGANVAKTALGEHQVAICPFSADWTDATAWSSPEPVGGPEWPVTNMIGWQGIITVQKGDGFYFRDRLAKQFINAAERLEDFLAHATNGKGSVAGENCVWYPTNDRKLYKFQDGYLYDATPFRRQELARDVVVGRITAMVDRGATVQAIEDAWGDRIFGRHAAALGVRVFKETNAGVITELTTDVTDDDLTTPATANMNAWGGAGAAGSWRFVVGSPFKLEGVIPMTPVAPNSAVQSLGTPETLDGSGVWTSLGSVIDATILGVTGVSLALTAFPPSASEPILSWTAIDAWHISGLDTYNGIGGLYWYSWKNVTTTAMTATATIAELGVIPGRPGLPNSDRGILTQAINFTNRVRAGAGISRLLEMTRANGREEWAVRGLLYTLGGVTKIGWMSGPTGSISSSGPSLVVLGRFKQKFVAESPTRDPSQSRAPRPVKWTTSTPGSLWRVAKIRLGDARKLSKFLRIGLKGRYVQPGDKVQLFLQSDEESVWDAGVLRGSPAIWDLRGAPLGPAEEYEVFLVFQPASQTLLVAPYWTHLLAEFDDYGDEWAVLNNHHRPSVASPERV